jgi:diguanylate cyclase (GGDEF)-like protein
LLLRLAGVAGLLLVLTAVLVPNHESTRLHRGLDALDFAAALVPVLFVLIRARTDRHRRQTWLTLAAALAVFAIAALSALQFESVTPRVSDMLRVSGAALLAVALGLVTRRLATTARASERLDGVVLVLGASAGASLLWSAPFQRFEGDAYELRVAVLLVMGDLVALTVLAAVVSAMRYRPSPAVFVAVLAIGLLLAADLGYLSRVLGAVDAAQLVVPPRWSQDLRLLSSVLLAIAAWLPRTNRRQPTTRSGQLNLVPVVFSLVALGILGVGILAEISVFSALLALGAIAAVVLRTAVTVHELNTSNESYRLARTDELTSLTNRRGFLEGLDRLVEVAPQSVAVMIIDLNGFKEVNDSLGHHAGDELLRLVADRFKPVVGDAALLARLGGDEFGVVILVPDQQAAVDGAHLLQQSLVESFEVDGVPVRVGAAIGVALYPEHSRSRTGVMRSADVAMYDAKQRRTGVEVYRPSSDFQTREKLQLLEDLRQAIEHRGLSLWYQPKVSLADGKITGSEALVRWEHPTRGLMMPDDFVPIAERAGLVPGLTRAVLAQAIAFHAERCPHVGVSVNISHRDVVDESLADYIADLLTIYGYPADKLTLEITETELAHDPERATRSIALLRRAGMQISIDDFGVGYSSMARLLDLPVDEVKIDKSFVFAIDADSRAIAIIRSTVELAAALELRVVAEGIENPHVLQQVREAGVHIGQGYVFTRPLAGKDYLDFLAARTKGAAPTPLRPPVLPDRSLPRPAPTSPSAPPTPAAIPTSDAPPTTPAPA